jgi:hypothetical protein
MCATTAMLWKQAKTLAGWARLAFIHTLPALVTSGLNKAAIRFTSVTFLLSLHSVTNYVSTGGPGLTLWPPRPAETVCSADEITA